MKKLLSLLVLISIIGGIGAYFYYQQAYDTYLVTPVDEESSARVNFNIEKGETGQSISARLAELELVPAEWAFYKYIKDENIAPQLEAGKFVLKKSYTIPEIAEFLTNARKDEVVLTIREGLTIKQVDEYLAEKEILPAGSFIDCAKNCQPEERKSFLDSKPSDQNYEGYLFPDTYFVDPETISPQGLYNRMLTNFENKLDSELRSEIAKRGTSIHQMVIMASLIEKESRKDSEKAIISGILWKRYNESIGLGVDATVRFALDKWTGALTLEDLDVDSPYNTRRYRGLPPGPISNFSLSSLSAAIKPESSDYYYYLHGADGQIHYGKTNAEHNENKKYL
jgi:UPF0755 protein